MLEESLEYTKKYIFDNSYARMIIAFVILILTFVVRVFVMKILNTYLEKSTKEVKNDPTNYKFLKHAISAMIFLVGFSVAIYSVPSLRSLANSLLAGAGIFAVAIGFASQQAFSNIISGIFIIVFKPFRINDRLTIKETISGIVEDITLRHTVIRNFENRRVVIPNSIISSETIVNSDLIETKICKIMDLGVGYDTDIDQARSIIQEEVMKHKFFLDNRDALQIENNEPPVVVRVTEWKEYSINMRVWIWTNDSPSAYIMGCDLFESIKKRFDEVDIEIPFPHRKIVYKNEKESI